MATKQKDKSAEWNKKGKEFLNMSQYLATIWLTLCLFWPYIYKLRLSLIDVALLLGLLYTNNTASLNCI